MEQDIVDVKLDTDDDSSIGVDPRATPQGEKMSLWAIFVEHKQKVFVVLGPIIGIPMFFLELDSRIAATAYVALWMGFYWMSEAIPLAATALFPLVLFPVMGVLPADGVASSYFNDTLMFLFGCAEVLFALVNDFRSFVFASAMEKWNLHTKVALKFLLLVGARPKVIMLGFMLITGFLSMWISNTATTAMMTPLCLALLEEIELQTARKIHPSTKIEDGDESVLIDLIKDKSGKIHSYQSTDVTLRSSSKSASHSHSSSHSEESSTSTWTDSMILERKQQLTSFSTAILLSLAWASSIGGTATLIGTGPNVILVQTLRILFPKSPEISFGMWFLVVTPLALAFLLFAFAILTLRYARKTEFKINRQILVQKHEELGPITFPQMVLIAVFLLQAILWFSRKGFGEDSPGWGQLFLPKYVTDGTVGLVGCLILFFIPDLQNGTWNSKTGFIADSETITRVNWNAILVLAGGFGLATGISKSGLSLLIRDKLIFLDSLSLYPLLLALVGIVLAMTEFMSNVSAITVLGPILGLMAVSIGENPMLFMITATIAASCAFMLPVGTPPNTIVYGTGKVSVQDMALSGLVMNIFAAFIIPAYLMLVAPAFGIELGKLPEWANSTATA